MPKRSKHRPSFTVPANNNLQLSKDQNKKLNGLLRDVAAIKDDISRIGKGLGQDDEAPSIRESLDAPIHPKTPETPTMRQRVKRWWSENWSSILTFAISTAISIAAICVSAAQASTQIEQANEQMRQSAQQVRDENRKWNAEGASYSLFFIDSIGLEFDYRALRKGGDSTVRTQNVQSLVVSNSGRTEGTLVSLSRITKNPETMLLCVPTLDQNGYLTIDKQTSGKNFVGGRQISLQPGQSQLVFFMDKAQTKDLQPYADHRSGFSTNGYEHTNRFRLYSADGAMTERTVKTDVPDEVISYYRNLPGYTTARRTCEGLINNAE